jgi:hypothetical protein
VDGDIYILPAGKTGSSWGAMADGALAYYRDGVWEEVTPREGFLAHIDDTNLIVSYSGAAWLSIANGLSVSATDRILGRISSGAGAAEEVAFTDQAQALCDDTSFQQMCATLGSWRVLAQSAVAASLTGVTTDSALASIAIPAGAMGPNGRLRVTTLWSITNSANAKTLRVRLGGLAGTAFQSIALTTSASFRAQCEIANRNNQASQVGANASIGSGGWSATGAAIATAAIDTSAAATLVISGQLANGGETITLEGYLVELAYGA